MFCGFGALYLGSARLQVSRPIILAGDSIRKLPFFLIDSVLPVGFQADLPLFSILKGRCTMVSNFRSPSRCMVRFSVLSLTAAMVFLSATVYAQTSAERNTIAAVSDSTLNRTMQREG